ncbi:hypothetical protein [Treponema socranskii]|nr:hypothetical protein [Treponema socranskii]MDR9859148.1 hypothetical protein [Treponema socranskii]
MQSVRKKTKTKIMSFSITSTVFDEVDAYCKERGCSRSWFINKAVSSFMKDCLENKADYDVAIAALERFKKSNGKTYTSDELRKEFGL